MTSNMAAIIKEMNPQTEEEKQRDIANLRKVLNDIKERSHSAKVKSYTRVNGKKVFKIL